VSSALHFVHGNDHASREAELKKKRVSPLPWGGERGPSLKVGSAEVLARLLDGQRPESLGFYRQFVDDGREGGREITLILDFCLHLLPSPSTPYPLLFGFCSH
jgi:hypothetical protein